MQRCALESTRRLESVQAASLRPPPRASRSASGLDWHCRRPFKHRGPLLQLVLAVLALFPFALSAEAPPSSALGAADRTMPVADAHLHYKWNQAEVTSPEEAVAALKANNVALAVVTGTPGRACARAL